MKQLSYRFIELTFFVPMRFIFKVDVNQFWCCNKTYWSVLCSYFSHQGIPIIRRHLCQTRLLLRDRREYMISNASTFVTQCVTGWAKLSFYLNLSKITKAEESLPTLKFRLFITSIETFQFSPLLTSQRKMGSLSAAQVRTYFLKSRQTWRLTSKYRQTTRYWCETFKNLLTYCSNEKSISLSNVTLWITIVR